MNLNKCLSTPSASSDDRTDIENSNEGKKTVNRHVRLLACSLMLLTVSVPLCSCGQSDIAQNTNLAEDSGNAFAEPENDKDLSNLTAKEQESAYTYSSFFLPSMDGTSQPYVGDTMPYYEDGVYYIYYLKDQGDSYHHSIYLATTTDFVTYEEQDEPVIEASLDGGQDDWIGTGSVVKVGETYYFFYTGHTDSEEYHEKIMVASGNSPVSFEKMAGWEITPPDELNQKNDFRDPQAYYDPETETIAMTMTASKDGVARILKYTLSADLQTVTYDGIIFTNSEGDFWNLECSDTFRIGDTWYITYSAQDDTLWYASSDIPYGPYGDAKRMEGKLFYAAKHVEDGENAYMVGWARRSESVTSLTSVSAWAGNLAVQKIVQKGNGELILAPADNLVESFSESQTLALEDTDILVEGDSQFSYTDTFTCCESFLITGKFRYTGEGSFGLSFDYNGESDKNKMISISPAENKLQLLFKEGNILIAETEVDLTPGENYDFTYIQEGSVGIFYINDMAALTVRIYGASGKPIQLFAQDNSVQFSSLQQYTRP